MECDCNLEDTGNKTLVLGGKDWQHVGAALCSPSVLACSSHYTLALGLSFAGPAVVTNCSAVLQNCLNDQTKQFHW